MLCNKCHPLRLEKSRVKIIRASCNIIKSIKGNKERLLKYNVDKVPDVYGIMT